MSTKNNQYDASIFLHCVKSSDTRQGPVQQTKQRWNTTSCFYLIEQTTGLLDHTDVIPHQYKYVTEVEFIFFNGKVLLEEHLCISAVLSAICCFTKLRHREPAREETGITLTPSTHIYCILYICVSNLFLCPPSH